MSAHTPGPWQIEPRCCEDDDVEVSIISDYKRLPNGRSQANWIAECDLQQDNDTNWANARLIAAAPELLEAIELAESILAKISRGTIARAHEMSAVACRQAPLALIRAAIAKAKGEGK